MTKETLVSSCLKKSKVYMPKTRGNEEKISKKKKDFKNVLEKLRKSYYKYETNSTIDSISTQSEITYTTIKYLNERTQNIYSFKCYDEKSLNFPVQVKENIISRSCDDDCLTDDEQINHAVKNLYNSLEEVALNRKLSKKIRKRTH